MQSIPGLVINVCNMAISKKVWKSVDPRTLAFDSSSLLDFCVTHPCINDESTYLWCVLELESRIFESLFQRRMLKAPLSDFRIVNAAADV